MMNHLSDIPGRHVALFPELPAGARSGLLLLALTLLPAAACPGAQFVAPDQIEIREILPAPPGADSLATQAELEVLVQLERARTPEQTGWAANPPTGDVFAFAGTVLGPWFTAENLPSTAALFARIDEDGGAIINAAKGIHPVRERPFVVEPLISQPTSRPGGSTYPSGAGYHTAVWTSLLATIFPEFEDALRARAQFACWTRVLAGVHYPSDNTAGRILGDAVAQVIMARPDVRAALAEVRGEIHRARNR